MRLSRTLRVTLPMISRAPLAEPAGRKIHMAYDAFLKAKAMLYALSDGERPTEEVAVVQAWALMAVAEAIDRLADVAEGIKLVLGSKL